MLVQVVLVHGPASAGCRCREPVVHLVADVPEADSVTGPARALGGAPAAVAGGGGAGGIGALGGLVGAPGAVLAALLARVCGDHAFTVDETPLAHLVALPATGTLVVRAGVPPASTGPPDGLRAAPASAWDRASGLVLGVAGGAGAGSLLALRRGWHTLGRAGTDLVIDDPSVSRHHAVLEVLADRLLLTDTASANGSMVNGRAHRRAEVTVDSSIRLGAAPLRLRAADDPLPAYPTTVRPAVDGTSTAAPPPAASFRGNPPGLVVVSTLLPLLIGLVLALTTGSWLLLGLTAVSAPVGLLSAVSALRARRQGTRPRGRPPGPGTDGASRHTTRSGHRDRGAGAEGRERERAARPDPTGVPVPDLTTALLAARQHASSGSTGGHRAAPVAPAEAGLADAPTPRVWVRLGAEPEPAPAWIGRRATGRMHRAGSGDKMAAPWMVPGPTPGQRREAGGQAAGGRAAGGRGSGGPNPAGPWWPPGNAARPVDGPARRDSSPVALEVGAHRRVDVVGGPAETSGVVRALLTQLTGAEPALRLGVCAGPDVTTSARLLPSVVVLSRALAPAHRLDGGLGTTDGPPVGPRVGAPVGAPADGSTGTPGVEQVDVLVVEVDRLDPAGRARLARVLRDPSPVVWLIGSPDILPDGGGAQATVLRLGDDASLYEDGVRRPLVADLMPTAAFERYCLWRAACPLPTARTRPAALPARCAAEAVLRRAAAHITSARLPCVLGLTADGPLVIDLATEGPHLLVAGTTGSGKSELLRTLVTSLTRDRSPTELGLVLIDFKGGAALAPLAALPHCDALITDLDDGLDRALVSVQAELRRREALVLRHGVDTVDDPGVPADLAPGRLVIVIDEFRVMADDHPDELARLVRLAAQGRSLGIHLVMATQRPRGAVNGDIRANTAIRIALRTQSADESFDVLGSALAADLPASVPGRGWISVGDRPPVLFQTATAGLAHAEPRVARWDADGADWVHLSPPPSVPPVAAPLLDSPLPAAPPPKRTPDRPGAAGPASARIRRRVLAAPLPAAPTAADVLHLAQRTDHHEPGDPCSAAGSRPAVRARRARAGTPIGLVDRPDEQRLDPWLYHPGADPHLAVLGEDRTAVAAALRRLTAAVAADARCYLLDAGDALADLLPAPQVGARVTATEPQRAVRVLERLCRAVEDRAAPPGDGAEAGSSPVTPLMLVVHDWSLWSTTFRAQPWSGGEELVLRLTGVGPGARLGVIVSGGRDLLAGRLIGSLGQRVHVPGAGNTASLPGGPRLPRVDPLPGRVVVEGAGCGPAPARAQLIITPPIGPRSTPDHRGRPGGDGPVIHPLPERLSVAEVRRWADAAGGAGDASDVVRALPVSAVGHPVASAPFCLLAGIGGDGRDRQVLRIGPGRVLPIVGAPGSGRSTVLRALAALNDAAVVLSAPRTPARGRTGSDTAGGDTGMPGRWEQSAADTGPHSVPPPVKHPQGAPSPTARGGHPGARANVLLLDDADAADPSTLQRLAEQLAAGHAAVVTVTTATALSHRLTLIGPALAERHLVAVGVDDPAALVPLGIRLPVDPVTVRGRAVWVHGSGRDVFQVPDVPESGDEPVRWPPERGW